MEARVQQFHAEALKGIGPKTKKEIATLRRFLFKNQNHRFSENEKAKIFATIQTYYGLFKDATTEEENPVLGLLDDALKMPFTIITTKQKKSMLKWYSGLKGADLKSLSVDFDGEDGEEDRQAETRYQLLDISDDGYASLFQEDSGETRDDVKITDKKLRKSLQKSLVDEGDGEGGGDVYVIVSIDADGETTISRTT